MSGLREDFVHLQAEVVPCITWAVVARKQVVCRRFCRTGPNEASEPWNDVGTDSRRLGVSECSSKNLLKCLRQNRAVVTGPDWHPTSRQPSCIATESVAPSEPRDKSSSNLFIKRLGVDVHDARPPCRTRASSEKPSKCQPWAGPPYL